LTLVEFDAAGSYSMGEEGLGIALPDGAGSFGTLLRKAQMSSQEAGRLGQAGAFASQTLAAGTKTDQRPLGWLSKRRSLRTRWCKKSQNWLSLVYFASASILMNQAIFGYLEESNFLKPIACRIHSDNKKAAPKPPLSITL
jgi:hypothetical protein